MPRAPAVVRSLVTDALPSDDRERLKGTLEGMRDLVPSHLYEDLLRGARLIETRNDALAFLGVLKTIVTMKLEPTAEEQRKAARTAARRARARNARVPEIS